MLEYHGISINFSPAAQPSNFSEAFFFADDWDLFVRAEVQTQNVGSADCHQVTTLGGVKRQVMISFWLGSPGPPKIK